MSNEDWLHPTKRKWAFTFQLVPPNKLNDSWGTLDKVDISSVSITEGYYTDTRIQGKMTYYDTLSADHRQAYIRIIATDTSTGVSEELGTFIPTSDDVTMEGSVIKTSVNLESILYGISMQKLPKLLYYYSDRPIKVLYELLLRYCNFVYGENFNYAEDLSDDRLDLIQATVDAGTSMLEVLYKVCNTNSLRLAVDGHGCVWVNRYTVPKDKPATFTITTNSSDSIVLDGITRSSNYLEMASQVTVHATSGDSEITSTQTATGRLSQANRGYIVGKYYDTSSLSSFTQAQADTLAKSYLSKATNENMEWTLTTEYMPIYCGDVGTLTGLKDNFHYGTSKKVLVKSRDLDLATMTQKLTLKLASSNDTDSGDVE